jgi:hypothetical protein
MPISWIEYKGRKILFIDLKGVKTEETIASLEKQRKIIDESSEPVLILHDFRDTLVNKEYMDKAIQYSRNQKNKIKKTALFGITEMKKILVDEYISLSKNKNTRFFDSITDAKEYLVAE